MEPDSTWLSVLVLAEIRRGIEQIRNRDSVQAAHLERWLLGLQKGYASKILPISPEIADRWGVLNAANRLSYIDGFLAATALEHNLVLVTRNTADIENSGVKYLNPFLP